MKRPISVVAASALAAATIAAVASGPAAQADAAHAGGHGPAFLTLSGTAPAFAIANRAIGAVSGSQKLTIQVWLKPRIAAAEGFATAVSTPGSKLYGHFLSPAGYAARFGASSAEAAGVESWLRSAGFSGVAADAGRDYVRATAAVSSINAAFRVRMNYYRPSAGASAGKYPLRANDQAVSVPSSLAASVLGVTGLDNAAPEQTFARPVNPSAPADSGNAPSASPVSFPCSSWYAQHYAHGLPGKYGTKSFPTVVCGYSAKQFRRAYGWNRHNIGKGVTIAFVEIGLVPDMMLTLSDYARVNGIETPSTSRYSELALGQGSGCGEPFNGEEQLDVETAYDMAPLANELVVGGDSCNNGFFGLQSLFDADTAILNGAGGRPFARIVSNSWEADTEATPVNILNVEHAYLVRAAAEGVSMLFSSGDASGVETPSSDPFATAVGGTTLGIGDKVARLFETGWSTGTSVGANGRWVFQAEQGAAGGGPSMLWTQPAYQRGVVPNWLAKAPGNRPGLVRAVPDISADADPFTGIALGLLKFNSKGAPAGFFEEPAGGTSLAAPLVAAIVADAEQYQRPFGFLNPALYRLAGTNAVNDSLRVTSKTPVRYRSVACDAAMCGLLTLTSFDVESFGMIFYTGQVTRTGYDTMTGIGTPHGQNFIYALRKLEAH
jgi:subtilase family serine protease